MLIRKLRFYWEYSVKNSAWLPMVGILFVFACSAASFAEDVDSIQAANKLAHATGRPIIVVGGLESCAHCKALKKELDKNAAVAPLAAQFVELDMDVESAMWKNWTKKYKAKAGGTPYFFIVRADGELLYKQSGPIAAGPLANLLKTQLAASGTLLSHEQLSLLQTIVAETGKALEAGDEATAARHLAPLHKLNPPGKLGSYATAATQAEDLYTSLVQRGKQSFEQGKQKLAGGDPFVGGLGIVSASRAFGSFPALKEESATALRELKSTPEFAELLPAAEALDKALALTVQKSPQAAKNAEQQLRQILEKYPNSPAAAIARTKLPAQPAP